MNEQRQEAYLALIQQLLSCPRGEEPEILAANQDLKSPDLVQVMLEMASNLRWQGELNQANRLMNIAGHLLGVYGNSNSPSAAISQEYLDFLRKVLQATVESNGNPQVIHTLLQANLNKLNDNFTKTLRNCAAYTFSKVEPKQVQLMARYIGDFSTFMQDFTLGNKQLNLDIAITGHSIIAKVFTRQSFPKEWAMNLYNLGNAYYKLNRGKRSRNLEKSICCYRVAMQIYTQQDFPHDWANIQNNLGTVYCERIKGERSQNLETAIAHYQEALKVRTRDRFPQQWANIKNNLGTAYCERIRGKRFDNLEAAIRCFFSALKIRKREVFPERWAETQISLGLAYRSRLKGERAENIERAIKCLNLALKIQNHDNFPQEWAHTQYNLGLVYENRIRGNIEDNHEEAIKCYLNALKVFTYENFPQYWADTKNGLGNIYLIRHEQEGRNTDNIRTSIVYFLESLKDYSREEFPERWAGINNNLGNAYLYYKRGDIAENINLAIHYYQAALQIYTHKEFPEKWAVLQNNLGNAFLYCRSGNRQKNLDEAIKYYLAALQIRKRQVSIQNYAETQFNLGLAYQAAQKFNESYKAFEEGVDAVESMRVEIISGSGIEEDKKKLAEEWNKIYQEMVHVCLEIAQNNLGYYNKALEYVERSKARNLVELLTTKNLYPNSKLYSNPETYQTHCKQLDRLRSLVPVKQRETEILMKNRESEEKYKEEIEQRRQELNELRQKRDKLLEEINQVDPKFSITQKVESIPFSDIHSLTDNNTALVEWYITDRQIIAFIIAQHNSRPIVILSSLESLKSLEQWNRQYQEEYRQHKSQWEANLVSHLQKLATILNIDKIVEKIPDECNRLILIPHRYLHLFPLHALLLADSKLLLDRFPGGVSYAPSCQLLQLTEKQERSDFSNFFALQNPTGDLIYTNLEVEAIGSLFPRDRVRVLAQQAATKSALSASNEFPVAHCIHFSCHGTFSLESPLESALILANREHLTLGEIFGLNLEQCRLVTLSACETGLTDPNSLSDEYIGLPSGFLLAGSPSVVSSLWTVNDLSTSFLMMKFYETLREQQKQNQPFNSAIALNHAQKWLRNLTCCELEQEFAKPQFKNAIAQLQKTLSDEEFFEIEDAIEHRQQKLQKLDPNDKPLANPYYWAAFIATGV